MAKLNTEDLLGQFKEMSLVELSDFVKAFEKEFDVTAAAPVAVAAAGGAAAGGAAADAAQDEFTIILEDAGAQKIAVIKEVRALNSSLGLKEAKDLVDATPATLLEKADKATADKAKAALEAAGGAAAGGAAADAAQDEFTIILEDAGAQKIAVIKEVRALNSSLGLKEAKDLVDATPATLLEKADKATADKAKAALEAAGAKVTIK